VVDAFESDQALKIMASGKDIKRVREIVAASPVLKDRITGVSEAACMGGVICESVDGKVSVDNTYDTRLQMLIPRILPQVGKVLFGEHER